MPFKDISARVDALENALLDEKEPRTDAESIVRVELANLLARVRLLVDALAADEEL